VLETVSPGIVSEPAPRFELPPDWKSWSVERKKKLRRRLAAERARVRMRDWRSFARYKQLPPDDPRHGYAQTVLNRNGEQVDLPACQCHRDGPPGPDNDWMFWLLMSGRGFGKTWVGASWLYEQAITYPDSEWCCIAPTFSDTRRICIEGSTGLLRAMRREDLVNYRRNDLELELSNGSKIFGFSADRPDRVRGSNLWGFWAEELGSWRYEATWHEGLMPALRKGEKPRGVITTTPRGTSLLRELAGRDDGSVHITQGSTLENEANLSEIAVRELYRRYGGTRIGRQELEGELIADVEGALWQRAWLETGRLIPAYDEFGKPELPPLQRVVVAMDPSTTSKATSAEFGIMVVGLGTDGHIYLLDDLSGRMTPNKAMRTAVAAYYEWEADRIVGEMNNGGDFIEALLHTEDENVPYRTVVASRGKQVRAEPASSFYEQGRAHHVGTYPRLEDQLCTWTPLDPESPDRLDALVWGVTELTQNLDWTKVYGPPYTCPKCDRLSILMKDRPSCPYCHEPIDAALLKAIAA
jgi:phage terminase large subunit-like protein